MALLQEPLKSLDQIEWYLENRRLEKFPEAFLIAAGNLCRQLTEQILFIICFYGGLPRNKYLKPDLRLKDARYVTAALGKAEPSSGRTYWEMARRRGARIRKFARLRRKFGRWRRLFNDPSHYSIPGHVRKIRVSDIEDFIKDVKPVLDNKDSALLVAAFNELLSHGKIVATMTDDPENSPAISKKVTVKISDLAWDGNAIGLPGGLLEVLSSTEETRPRKVKDLVLVEGVAMPVVKHHFVTEHGNPIDLTNGQTFLASFVRSEKDIARLKRRFAKFGVTLGVEVVENTDAKR